MLSTLTLVGLPIFMGIAATVVAVYTSSSLAEKALSIISALLFFSCTYVLALHGYIFSSLVVLYLYSMIYKALDWLTRYLPQS